MTIVKAIALERFESNNGQYKERCLAYTLVGRNRKSHDHLAYNKGSDIPELEMSVKSSGFSLMSGNMCVAQDFEGILNEYISNTASKQFAYVAEDMTTYIMDLVEFVEFLRTFGTLAKESSSKGGRKKIRAKSESQKMIHWLNARVCA